MENKTARRFFVSIVIPAILAIGLFVLSLFAVILPAFEQSIMEKKKEMISELTRAAWSLVEEYHHEHQKGNLSLEEARAMAASRVKEIRYGEENKDYFWIIDQGPTMIMHPYRGELVNQDLSNYTDPNGKKLFVEATQTVSREGEGFIHYMWQWKDDSTRIVPKLSFVKGFEPWNWIIGTGIYLEDVKAEISSLTNRILRVALIITGFVTIILLFIIRQSLAIEGKRTEAEQKLRLSRQKYKSLVEASTEGTLMLLNGKVIFTNMKFGELSGYETHQLAGKDFIELFDMPWENLITSFTDPEKSVSMETRVKCNDGGKKDVIVSVSKIKYGSDNSYIVVVKEVSQRQKIEKNTEQLAGELQDSLLLMNQPIRKFAREIISCPMNTSIQEAISLMSRKKRDVLFIHQDEKIIGVLTNNDIIKRVLATGLDTGAGIMEAMSAPVVSIPESALLYEALLLIKNKNISHLAIRNNAGAVDKVLGHVDIARMQLNTVSYMIKEIGMAENIDGLVSIHDRLPVLVNALIESGDKTQNITRVISSVSDAISRRVIELGIEKLGNPPCEFVFMVMGSEGRMEQTLATDQDNAIILADLDEKALARAKEYFTRLGEFISYNLNKIGYAFCGGDIMVQNPRWVQPLSRWKEYFTGWINESDPKSVMEATIFFDFRPVYGKESLCQELRAHVNQASTNKAVFFYHLAQSILKYKPPVGLFGNIVGSQSSGDGLELNIKKSLMPVTGFIRLYALQSQLDETNSLNRLNQLYNLQIIKKSLYDELLLSYNHLMHLRLRFQARGIMQNEEPGNMVNIDELTHIEIATLKKIFGEIGNLQTKVNFDYKGGGL